MVTAATSRWGFCASRSGEGSETEPSGEGRLADEDQRKREESHVNVEQRGSSSSWSASRRCRVVGDDPTPCPRSTTPAPSGLDGLGDEMGGDEGPAPIDQGQSHVPTQRPRPDRWPDLAAIDIRFRTNFAYVDGTSPDGAVKKLCRLLWGGTLQTLGFATYRASADDPGQLFPNGMMGGSEASTAPAASISTTHCMAPNTPTNNARHH
jgi:hypothetical protein